MTRTPTLSFHALAVVSALLASAAERVHAQEYCVPDVFALGVEPICRLAFADIDNTSPGTSAAPAHEDFTAMTAHLEAGGTYSVTASGYTGGTPPNQLAANFDWDGDFIFETHVELADIVGDNCDTETTGSFTVPIDALIGTSRVRFVKTFSYDATDNGCAWFSSYGQSEDYTVEVQAASSIVERRDDLFRLLPNPSNGTFVLENRGLANVTDITVVDVSGRIVHTERATFGANARHHLDLSGRLTPGTYSAVILSTEARSVIRFIVQ
ncbi:MAG TPA: T9SS type A sorting domain-containing protein [Flavobacteriales bacterium]